MSGLAVRHRRYGQTGPTPARPAIWCQPSAAMRRGNRGHPRRWQRQVRQFRQRPQWSLTHTTRSPSARKTAEERRCDMPRVFREGSLSFRYPDNWQLEREDNDHGWTVSVYSPGTAFLTLSLDTDYPDTERVADTALEAMRSEYPELEADERAEPFAGQPAVGHDISFFSLDLTNTCWTRSFDCPDGT